MVWLDNSRIIAIFAVVVLHAAVSPVVDTPFGSTDWWAGNLINAFSRWCVPVFVMISGQDRRGDDHHRHRPRARVR